ncbi:MAG: right-handed parallel beta-helix repeat-containing protein [Phycisphaerales bacterium]|nr:right-handed parallel beta-helix repeat-containing protein [Phycisphaerales bacterium]
MISHREIESRIAVNAENTPGDEQSLFRIAQPGSYYLPGNLRGVKNKYGISIAASGVTLDLNGFDVVGVTGSLDGIAAVVDDLRNIAVIGGSVREWAGDGIDLASASPSNCLLQNLRVSDNTGNGLVVSNSSTVRDCVARSNAGSGIVAGARCTVIDCTSSGNGSGVSAGHGIVVGSSSTIAECSVVGNGTGPGGGSGILAGQTSMVRDCVADGNGSETSPTRHGIEVSSGATVAGCSVTRNKGDGIRASAQCLITSNKCVSNGEGGDGAGIHITGTRNRVEGNQCDASDRGIDVDADENIIIRNTCTNNAINWDIAANNVFGPIIDRTDPGSLAVSGNSAAGSLGTADANANFTY